MLRRFTGSLRPAQLRGMMRALSPEEIAKRYDINQPKIDYSDLYSKHRSQLNIQDSDPKLASDAFIAPCATVAGNVELWDGASVWYGSVVRSEWNLIRIGAFTNIQDKCVITESPEPLGPDHDGSTVIGHFCTVGHGTHMNACTVEAESHIGMGCILMEGSYVEGGSMLGAGTVLLPHTRVPAGQLWVGNPGKYVRDLTSVEKLWIVEQAENYAANAKAHAEEFFLPYPMEAIREAQAEGHLKWDKESK